MLEGADRQRLSELMQRLATLGTAFSQNVLADEKVWEMPLEAADLEGLPDFLVSALAEAAAERSGAGHVLTLSRSVIVPFLQLSPAPGPARKGVPGRGCPVARTAARPTRARSPRRR